jgi:hypothetical protein
MKKQILLEKQEKMRREYLKRAKKLNKEIKEVEKKEDRKAKRDFLKLIKELNNIELDSDVMDIFLSDNYSLILGFLTVPLDDVIKEKLITNGKKVLKKIREKEAEEKARRKEQLRILKLKKEAESNGEQ